MVPSQLLFRPPITSMYVLSVGLASVLLATSARAAETTNATCTKDPYLTNKEDVNPCQLAVMLEGACFNGNFFLPALPQGELYDGPLADTSNTCQCSSVTYSVVQACAACQGGSTTPWLTWSVHCDPSHIAIGSYPVSLPGVKVPAWAFVNVTMDGIFNAMEASASATLPESSLTAPTSTSGSPSNSNTSPASNSKSSSHTGAIVGGVIGGIVGLALISLGAFFVYRRQRKLRPSQPRPVQEKVDMTQPNYRYTDSYSLAPPKLYDPADPTTFPQSPAPTMTNSLWTGTASPPPTSPGHRHGLVYSTAPTRPMA